MSRVTDPAREPARAAARARGQPHWVPRPASGPQRRLPTATPGGGLCSLATRAEGRGQLFRDVVESLGYSSFILEKIVEQSVEDMESLIRFSRERGVATWVNFKTRAYRFHQLVKSKLDPSEPVTLNTIGSNHGLATNGIHSVDLFAFYDGGSLIQSAGSQVDPALHPSKRGHSVFALSDSWVFVLIQLICAALSSA